MLNLLSRTNQGCWPYYFIISWEIQVQKLQTLFAERKLGFLPRSDFKDKVMSLHGDDSLPWMPSYCLCNPLSQHISPLGYLLVLITPVPAGYGPN